MAYRIRYIKRRTHKLWLTLGFFLLFLICAWYFAGDTLAQLVFPHQLEELIDAIEQGSGFAEAVSTFCQELMDGAQ